MVVGTVFISEDDLHHFYIYLVNNFLIHQFVNDFFAIKMLKSVLTDLHVEW